MIESSRLHRRALATAGFLAIALWAVAAAANPATVDYECSPSLPAGKRVSVDFNSGGNSITVAFPNGTSLRMTKAMSGSGVRYVGGNVEVFERGARPLVLNVEGQPGRECMRVSP
ncbi:MliC family protein [Terrarubrum flagellatum]|uniref:MliC family protein n=1 Tax=Terrirubrum flagellatum TaxID=2895980 RepID=UPI003144EE76